MRSLCARSRVASGAVAATVAALLLAACGTSTTSPSSTVTSASASSSTSSHSSALAADVTAELAGKVPASVKAELASGPPLGPGQPVPGYPKGPSPASVSMFHFSSADISKLKAGHYTAAIAMHLMNAAWPELQVQAITTTLKSFGIKVVAVTNPNFNASVQVNQLDTLIARHPTAIFSIAVDPTTEAATYKRVTAAGIKLILMDNVPSGLVPGKNYVTVVSANNYGDAEYSTERMVKALGCKGPIGMLDIGYYFPVVTTRDNAAKKVLSSCPGLSTVKQSFTTPTAQALSEASAMMQSHPNIKGFWAAWNTVAEQVVAAEKPLGKKVWIATSDLGLVSALEVAQGYINAIGAQQPYEQGVIEADSLAYNLLGKKVPYFFEAATVPVTASDLIPAYKLVMHQSPPADVIAALKSRAGL